jgi:hypothetical protein
MLTNIFQNHGANLKRWLGLLLVVFIFYGTTVEAAHRHGKVSSKSSHATCLGADPASSSTINTRPGCNDCLICQLHQNFSATLISFQLNTAPLRRLTPSNSSVPLFIRSTVHSPQSGRAPPKAN